MRPLGLTKRTCHWGWRERDHHLARQPCSALPLQDLEDSLFLHHDVHQHIPMYLLEWLHPMLLKRFVIEPINLSKYPVVMAWQLCSWRPRHLSTLPPWGVQFIWIQEETSLQRGHLASKGVFWVADPSVFHRSQDLTWYFLVRHLLAFDNWVGAGEKGMAVRGV